MPFYIVKYVQLICDHCGQREKKVGYAKDARKDGWAISKDYVKCYCPKCAPMFRNVGQAYNGYRPWASRK